MCVLRVDQFSVFRVWFVVGGALLVRMEVRMIVKNGDESSLVALSPQRRSCRVVRRSRRVGRRSCRVGRRSCRVVRRSRRVVRRSRRVGRRSCRIVRRSCRVVRLSASFLSSTLIIPFSRGRTTTKSKTEPPEDSVGSKQNSRHRCNMGPAEYETSTKTPKFSIGFFNSVFC